MAEQPEKELLFSFVLDQSDAPTFKVLRFEGFEAISQPFRFDITLVSDDADVDFDKVLNALGTFTLWSRDHSRNTPYHGMIAEFEQLGRVDEYVFYRAVLVPRMWRMGLNIINDVYLDEQTAPQVIASILQRNGLRGPDFRQVLKDPGVYRQRSFICQYQESDLAFISRWMEREGMYYFFDHSNEAAGDVLVMTDYKEGQPSDAIELRYTPPENVQTDRQDSCVTSFTWRKKHISANVLVQDFNYRKASMGDNLKGNHKVAGGSRGDVMYYGGNLRNEDEAGRLARVRSEELACAGSVFQGEAPAMGVRSGYFLKVENHYRDQLNDTYLVTEVHHQGSQTGVVLAGQNTSYNEGEQGSLYECRFSALLGSQQFRAACRTPRPLVTGVLNAVIDSEGDGKMAELNEYGQYKVQLLYDYSEKSQNKGSSWLRMATPYAGNDHGMHFPLLKGAEVLIGFIEGDPDQPVIVGAVPNSEHQSIIRDYNAACNAVKSASGNVMNLVDRAGKQGITMHSPTARTFVYYGSYPIAGKDATPSGSGTNPPDVISRL